MIYANSYINFQSHALSPYHVVDRVIKTLADAQFKAWQPGTPLTEGGWWLAHPDTKAVVAWKVPKKPSIKNGYAITASHVDSPTLRLRLQPFKEDDGVNRLLTQMHGGLIQRSWFDRPLYVAGKVWHLQNSKKMMYKKGLPAVTETLVHSTIPLAVIPDVAIHLDPQKNKDGKINPENALAAMFGCQETKELQKLFWEALKLDTKTPPDGFDLTLSPAIPHMLTGADQSYIVGPRHDDLAMVFSSLQALTEIKEQSSKVPVALFLDAEETGSATPSGAASSFIRDTLLDIANQLDSKSDYKQLQESFLISADMAHAWHPGFPQLHDSNHRPHINKGIVIKENANDRYATTGYSTAIIKGLCQSQGLSYQNFIARQDMGCGSTIGPTLSTALSCPAADIGLAQWAMHSSAETMGAHDLDDMIKLFKAFYTGENNIEK
ncbi:MAG: M18 family aminopeptidase [Oligoflexales bacterium]